MTHRLNVVMARPSGSTPRASGNEPSAYWILSKDIKRLISQMIGNCGHEFVQSEQVTFASLLQTDLTHVFFFLLNILAALSLLLSPNSVLQPSLKWFQTRVVIFTCCWQRFTESENGGNWPVVKFRVQADLLKGFVLKGDGTPAKQGSLFVPFNARHIVTNK